jgi:pimeloyl-ACP methyl ester carboxylesterase
MERRESRKSMNWEPDECAGLGPTKDGKLIEKLIRAPLNPWNRKDGYFDLYYVVQRPGVATRKTVLFCAGGPGEIVRNPIDEDTFASFLINNQYNVAFFHIRGAGFSQVPPSNRYDKFLRTRYAAEDIETIRTDFLGKNGKWDAIIAWSYGTVLAQQYAHYYSSKVEKLILLAPLSRHMFNSSANAFDEFNEDVRLIHRKSLERILGAKDPHFEEQLALKDGDKEKIVKKIFGDQNDPMDKGIFGKTENAFGSIQFVVDEYHNLSRRGILKDYGIDMYGRNFFRKLRQLRLIGSSFLAKQTRADELEIGKEIRDEILDKKRAIDDSLDLHVQRSDRVFYTVGALDGINPRFLKEWLARGRKNLRAALNRSGGEAHIRSGINSGLKKVNIGNREKVKPWDPAKYRHNVATLILKGEADPVTTGGQAEHLFRNALSGPRTLIEFPGIGHNFRLPDLEERPHDDVPSGVIRFHPGGIRPGEIRAVTGRIRGLKLKSKLHVNLTPPEDLKSIVKVLSIGFVEEGKILEPEKATNNVIALITNPTSKTLQLNIQQTDWHLSCYFFEGTVQINYWSLPDPLKHRLISGPITIPPHGVVAVYGKVFQGGRNSSRLYHLHSEAELEEGLQTLGFYISEGGALHLYLKATKQVLNASAKKWTLSRGSFSKTFRVKPPVMQEEELLEVVETIDGLKFDIDEEITVILSAGSEGTLGAYIPQEQASDKVPIVVTNTKDQGFNSRPGTWHIDSPYFTAAVGIDPPQIPPKGGVRIDGTLTEFRWKKWLEIVGPNNFDPELELMGFNILGENKISLMLKNRGTEPVRGGLREWIYIDPSERAVNKDEPAAVSLRMRRPFLNRLIYSFLVMEPARFGDERQNESLKLARTAFVGDDALAFKVESSDRSVKRIDKKIVTTETLRKRDVAEKGLTTFRTIG